MLTYFPETLRAGGLKETTDVCPVVRDGSGSPQRCGARWRRQGTVSKGFINSTEIVTAATTPSRAIEITCNQVNFLRNHNGTKSLVPWHQRQIDLPSWHEARWTRSYCWGVTRMGVTRRSARSNHWKVNKDGCCKEFFHAPHFAVPQSVVRSSLPCYRCTSAIFMPRKKKASPRSSSMCPCWRKSRSPQSASRETVLEEYRVRHNQMLLAG